MYYILSEKDTFTRMLNQLEFGSEKPKASLKYWEEKVQIEPVRVEEKIYGDLHLLLNTEIGTWCFLNTEEYKIYKQLFKGNLQNISQKLCMDQKILEPFIFHLYIRCMVKINESMFIEKELFEEGPITKEGPLFIILPTERCNFKCKYCFAQSDSSSTYKPMSKETGERIIKLIAKTDFSTGTIEFAGGEPLLAFEFIKWFIERAKEVLKGKNFHFVIQSNASLIDEEKAKYLKAQHIGFGCSLDGTEEENNKTRQYEDGNGTYKAITKGIEILAKNEVPCGVIRVGSNANLRNMAEGLKQYRNLGFRQVKVNPIFNTGRAKSNWSYLEVTPQIYLEVHKAYVDALCQDEEMVIDENLVHILQHMVAFNKNYRCMISKCGLGEEFFTFTPEGNIYPCSRFRHMNELLLGNVYEIKDLQELWEQNQTVVSIKTRRVQNIEKCKACTYKRFCEGGCSLDSYEVYENNHEQHPWCEYYKGMYDYLFQKLSSTPNLPKRLMRSLNIINFSFLK